MTVPVIYRWRITLRCGCVYRIESDPDLTKPMICGVIEPGSQHGMNMIINAERIES